MKKENSKDFRKEVDMKVKTEVDADVYTEVDTDIYTEVDSTFDLEDYANTPLNVEESLEFEKRINAEINIRIRKIALKVTCIVLGCVFLVFFCINPMMNLCYTNPNKYVSGTGDDMLTKVLGSYLELNFPYQSVYSTEVVNKGFGAYSIIANGYNKNYLQFEYTRNKLDINRASPNPLIHYASRFEGPQKEGISDIKDSSESDPKTMYLEEFEKLPDSAYIYLSISEKEPVKITDLVKEDLDRIWWANIYQENCEYTGGVAVHNLPCFYDGKEVTTDQSINTDVLDRYKESLQVLIDYKNLWNGLPLINPGGQEFPPTNPYLISMLQETLEKASTLTEPVSTMYCISGTKEQIMKYVESRTVKRLTVDKIKLSSLYWDESIIS